MRRGLFLFAALAALPACGGTLELDPIVGEWSLDEVTGGNCTDASGTFRIDSNLQGGDLQWQAACNGMPAMAEMATVLEARAEAGMGQYTVDLELVPDMIPLRWSCTVIENTQTMDCRETAGNDALTFRFSRA